MLHLARCSNAFVESNHALYRLLNFFYYMLIYNFDFKLYKAMVTP
jgi:hypothetical protein